MRIRKMEVRTEVTIEFSKTELHEAYEHWYKSTSAKAMFPKAFVGWQDINPDDITRGSISDMYKANTWASFWHGDTGRAIAYYLGFDGVANHGLYHENTEVRTITCYYNGAREPKF